ncbi:ATP-grasp domain-containing protein [Catenuloplanes japonicus]|uniref:ATP-grasp domain-containing protein n=1 Tax=Catenuloplanes japonicus TaxID=33876 RepID=UPI0005274E1E|nr:hypothetical protein [Catenuloplanes japonicus]
MRNRPYLIVVFRPDDFEPTYLRTATDRFFAAAAADAHHAGLRFRAIPHHALIPGAGDGPQLWCDGEDLLRHKHLFQVDEFSWMPQAHHHLHAIRRTVIASDSILLNHLPGTPDHLTTDKLAIVHHAAGLGMPALPTIAIPFGRYARTALSHVQELIGDGPYILKPREMGMGFGVLRCDTAEQLAAAIDITAQTGAGYIVQPYLPNDGDVRIFTVDGSVVATQHRRPAADHYLANISQGGSSTDGSGLADLNDMTEQIAGSLGSGFIYVDWLLTDVGPVVNEWSCGFGGHVSLPEQDRTRVSKACLDWARMLWDGPARQDTAHDDPVAAP